MRWPDFPYVVEIAVPERGLRGKRDAMIDFHTRLGITHRIRGAGKMKAAAICAGASPILPPLGSLLANLVVR
jgi:hypothetical protein